MFHARFLTDVRFACVSCLLLVITNLAHASVTDGLIHYWPLDEAGGAVAQDVAGNNDGLILNWRSGEATWVPGK